MDETTFQRELIQLKHRVAQMASTYYHQPSAQPALQDTFASQLDDVKNRLQSMQSSLGYLIAERSNSQQLMSPMSQPDELIASQAQSMFPPADNRLSLPSGPLFWQLFTSLRTDVRGLNNRVAALEMNISDLEDRVDSLDPKNHTPEASENDDSTFQQWAQELYPTNSMAGVMYPSPGSGGTTYQPLMDRNVVAPTNALPNISTSRSSCAETTPAPEGVAFRDREIAQLEELIRQTQEDLRRNEDLVSQKDAQLEQLDRERQTKDSMHHSRIAELDRISSERGKIAHAYLQDIQQLQSTLQSKDATLQTRAAQQYALQQSFLRKKSQLSQAGRHVQELERSLYELQNSKQDAINEIAATRDEEIKKLQDFCDAKETLVSSQEQIIKRGAKIIEERDEEIEQLSRRVKILNDDHRQEMRERERCSRLLDERDEEIKQLRASLTKALMPRSSHARPERRSMQSASGAQPRDGESLIQCSPFATTAASSPGKTFSSEQWSPQAIDRYTKLPHEQERESAWRRSIVPRYKFGVPGEATPPAQQESTRAAEGQRRDLRRSDSLKLLRRLALVEEGANNLPAQQGMTERSGSTQRQRLPLDDICQPPLPAPLPPRKAASLANLAARRDDEFGPEGQRSLARHQSIQDLPRSKALQPYVEEGEQDGEE